MNTLQLRNSFLLLLTAVIWGVAFVAQSVGMDYVGPYTFTCVRSFIGGLFLIPCIALLNRLNPVSPGGIRPSNAKSKDQLWIGGVCCGVMLCFASCFQQIGIMYTSVGKAGFITAFYIIIVPLLGLFFKKRCGLFVWLGVALAIVGLYFLCITESLTIQFGDFLNLHLRHPVFHPHFDHRLLHTARGRRQNVLHPVFRLRPALRGSHAAL